MEWNDLIYLSFLCKKVIGVDIKKINWVIKIFKTYISFTVDIGDIFAFLTNSNSKWTSSANSC